MKSSVISNDSEKKPLHHCKKAKKRVLLHKNLSYFFPFMNIAFFTDTYSPQINGVVTSIQIFSKELKKMGHNVYIFAPAFTTKRKRHDPKNVYRFPSAKVLFHPESRISLPYSRTLAKFQELEIDIIHSHTPFTIGLLALYLAKKHHIPLIHTYHTLYIEYTHYLPVHSDYLKNFAVWVSKSYCNTNNVVIAPSKAIKKELTSYNITSPILTIPTGIDCIKPHAATIRAIKKKYAIKDNLTYLITVSRLGKEKNITFLLHSFAKLIETHPKTRLIIVGDGPEKKLLQELAKKLGISRKIIFTGYIERRHIFALLSLAKVFVFASKTETQGLVLLEAMAMKIPVVAVNGMGVCDVLAGNTGGYLTKETKKSFVSHVVTLLNNKTLYNKKVKEAAEKAQQLSAKNMTSLLLDAYKDQILHHKK